MEYVCAACGRRRSVTTRSAKCDCGGLWTLPVQPEPFSLEKIDRETWSLFRYRAFLPLADDSWRDVTLGEGMTPVVRLDENVLLKMDYFMPTLSYKDRGAAVLIAHAKAIGVDKVVQDSSGNAGNAVAAYCAKAGIGCEIFVPEGTSPKKIDMIRAHGAVCTVVPGSRDHCADVCRETVERDGVYYANHVYNPFFYEGTKTYIYEVYEQLGRIPENLIIPVGNGTLFLGAVFALEHLLRSGCIDHMPQIIAVQSERCDPLLQAAEQGLDDAAAVSPQIRSSQSHIVRSVSVVVGDWKRSVSATMPAMRTPAISRVGRSPMPRNIFATSVQVEPTASAVYLIGSRVAEKAMR